MGIVAVVPRFAAISRHHVTSALDEHDSLGASDFWTRYGLGGPRDYVLLRGGQAYDSTAVLVRAHQLATGSTFGLRDLAAKDTAARILRELGFRVTTADDPEAVVPLTGAWRDVGEVGADETRDAWAAAGREVLLEAAGRYRATVTPKTLALEVQRRTGIRTRQLPHQWLGEVIGRVAVDGAQRQEPLLASLCVDDFGRVGDGYAVAVLAAGGERPEDPEHHAAHERLACYRHFQAVGLPADGGSTAALRPEPRATRSAAPRATRSTRTAAAKPSPRPTKPADRPVTICPTCFMALPATGVCDYCA